MSQPTASGRKTRVAFISLGCPKNTVDTEVMIQSCMEDDCEIVDDVAGSDVVVVNTCGFIAAAKEESIDTILAAVQEKANGNVKRVVVTGCLSQRYEVDLRQEIPEVDVFLGTEGQTDLPRIIRDLDDVPRSTTIEAPGRVPVAYHRRFRVTPRHWGYLKMSEGCDQACTFCAIPLMRGKFRSKPLDAIVEEATAMAADGARELVLVSQETASYGKDLDNDANLPTLLRRLSEVSGIEWLRLMYLFPKNITDELIGTIADNPRVVPYVDIPFQHCSDRILKRMGRQQTNAYLRELVGRFRGSIPDVTLRTTLMVGFPGETDAEFEELCDFVRESRFEHLGVFTYSEEEGTAAARFPDDVPEDVKEARRERLMALQADIAEDASHDLIGTVRDVLVDGISDESDDLLQGRLATQAPEIDGVVYINEGWARAGDFVRVEITDAHVYDVVGRIVGAVPGTDLSDYERELLRRTGGPTVEG